MINRTTKLRLRRQFRRKRRQVEGISTVAEDHFERHFFKRLSRLYGVRRFLISWFLLLIILASSVVIQLRGLNGYYQSSQPVAGGTFVEGILGSFTNANPLYATSSVDSSVARLLFASLFKYDDKQHLIGDLADSWTVDDRGTHYSVKLKDHLTWQDNYPLTAADVVFTYKSIQNPDTKSPLAGSWQGITVSSKDALTINFDLPSALSSFPYSMTNGIVPKHLLSGIPASQLRSVSFNTSKPVGAGPFKWDAVEVTGDTPENRVEQIALTPNLSYYSAKPSVNKFIIRSFRSEKALLASFKKQELNSMVGLSATPPEFKDKPNIFEYNMPLMGEVMVFLKTTNEVLKDTKIRQALTYATDTAKINTSLGYPVLPARGPLLSTQIGYDKTLNQLPFNLDAANKLLDQAGWPAGKDGLRRKDGKQLKFSLYSQNNPEYSQVVQLLQRQWLKVGVSVDIVLQSDSELQTSISFHNYDSLVFGISLGVDPDVFAFWHSSQADPRLQNRLNFSEYKSTVVDKALEAGRTRSDPAIRAVKYRPFLEAWHNDAPAIALYQPRLLIVTRGQIFGFDKFNLVSSTDRYANVQNWEIHEKKLQKPLTLVVTK